MKTRIWEDLHLLNLQKKRIAKKPFLYFKLAKKYTFLKKTGKLPKMAQCNGSTCISEDRLTALMKKIFAEALEKQKQSF